MSNKKQPTGHAALLEAIAKAKGQTALARKIPGIAGQSTVGNWVARKSLAPLEFCVPIEELTGVSRKRLRPHDWQKMWPELADRR